MAHDDHGLVGQRMVGSSASARREGSDSVDALLVKLASSLLMTLKSSTGSGRPLASETSTRWTQQAGALDVAQELRAQAGAEVRAFDQAGHIGDDEGFLLRLLADGDHAEVGFEGGEGVVGDLGPAAEMREMSVDLPALG